MGEGGGVVYGKFPTHTSLWLGLGSKLGWVYLEVYGGRGVSGSGKCPIHPSLRLVRARVKARVGLVLGFMGGVGSFTETWTDPTLILAARCSFAGVIKYNSNVTVKPLHSDVVDNVLHMHPAIIRH